MMMIRWCRKMGKGEGRGSLSAWEKVGNGMEGGEGETRREEMKEIYDGASNVYAAPCIDVSALLK
jgi:hypothetical protein